MSNIYSFLFLASALLVSTFLSPVASAQSKHLPLPSFPANFEIAEYKGNKGCIPDDTDYITAVAINAGTTLKGTLLSMQSPRDGAYWG